MKRNTRGQAVGLGRVGTPLRADESGRGQEPLRDFCLEVFVGEGRSQFTEMPVSADRGLWVAVWVPGACSVSKGLSGKSLLSRESRG